MDKKIASSDINLLHRVKKQSLRENTVEENMNESKIKIERNVAREIIWKILARIFKNMIQTSRIKSKDVWKINNIELIQRKIPVENIAHDWRLCSLQAHNEFPWFTITNENFCVNTLSAGNTESSWKYSWGNLQLKGKITGLNSGKVWENS